MKTVYIKMGSSIFPRRFVPTNLTPNERVLANQYKGSLATAQEYQGWAEERNMTTGLLNKIPDYEKSLRDRLLEKRAKENREFAEIIKKIEVLGEGALEKSFQGNLFRPLSPEEQRMGNLLLAISSARNSARKQRLIAKYKELTANALP